MKEQAQKLRTVLESERGAHDQLLAAAEAMNTALKGGQVAEVKRNAARYDELTVQIERLEEQRLAACDAIARSAGLNGHPNLSAIIAALPVEHRGNLDTVRSDLKRAITGLTKVNTSNRVLIESALTNVAQIMNVLTRPDTRLSGYKKHGGMDTRPVHRTFFNQIA